MKMYDEISEAQSERVFWVVQTAFAFVLARSFLEYRESLVAPLDHVVALLGLVLIYTTALLSWIDYSYTSIVSPYHLGKSVWEKCRFTTDLLIVGCYAILLFSGHVLQEDSSANIQTLFVVLAVVFLLYALSGELRVLEHGKKSSSRVLIRCFFAIFVAIAAAYYWGCAVLGGPNAAINVLFILAALAAMVSYRLIRAAIRRRPVWIGVDMDGVLANQIEGVLLIAGQKGGRSYSYEDITEWDLPVGETNIAEIIRSEQVGNKRYILDMPAHDAAQDTVDELATKYRIAVVTSRDPRTDAWTKQWLKAKGIHCDYYDNKKEGSKQNADVDVRVLIDDYPGNVKGFLQDESHRAILFDQPWNRQHGLQPYVDDGRLIVVNGWKEIPQALRVLLK